jgi:hypothetical protein
MTPDRKNIDTVCATEGAGEYYELKKPETSEPTEEKITTTYHNEYIKFINDVIKSEEVEPNKEHISQASSDVGSNEEDLKEKMK